MDHALIRKMIVKALKNYLWEESDCIVYDEEWIDLERKVEEQIQEENQEEAIYAIVQGVVYEYFTAHK